jgi:hypothetical protein
MKALEGYDKLKSSIRNRAQAAKVSKERSYGAGVAVISAAIAGAADAKYKADDGTPKKLVGPLPAVGTISAVAAMAGLTDYVPGAYFVGMAGVGGLCYVIGKYSHDRTAEHMAAPK